MASFDVQKDFFIPTQPKVARSLRALRSSRKGAELFNSIFSIAVVFQLKFHDFFSSFAWA